MEILVLWLKTIWSGVGKYAAAAGTAILALVALVAGHKYKVNRAEKKGRDEGVEQEQERIERNTQEKVSEMKERADEVHENSADLADHELADRMRSQQRRKSRR